MKYRAALWVVLSALFIVEAAIAAPVRVEWDPSPDPGVVGYRVYVGTEPGRYTETYEVGAKTSFEYQGALGQTYYFAVAAYTAAGILSGLSEELIAYPDLRAQISLDALGPPGHSVQTSIVCSEASRPSCFDVIQVLGEFGAFTSVGVLPDGRLLISDDGRRVRVAVGGQVLNDPALDVPAPLRVTDVLVDPSFARNRFVFVGIVGPRKDGSNELRIVRYRELNNQLGEAAIVIPGLPLGQSNRAPVAVDDAGHLFVALPGSGDSAIDRRAGVVLRFKTDGTVPQANRNGSPIVAYGFASPVALAWDATTQRLWLSGTDPQMRSPIANLSMRESDREWPLVPRPAEVSRPASTQREFSGPFAIARAASTKLMMLMPVTETQAALPPDAPSFEILALHALGTPVAVVSGANGPTYVALQKPPVYGRSGVFVVVGLQPR
jgi:hypothetical protein